MLKLKRVDIQGFKSFYDRAEMRFHGSGITAIVGPNGCGKSNLSDAISWVLGEQSAKSLRGASMEDVIFAGTRDRKPLGMAQVTLTMGVPPDHPLAQPKSSEAEPVPQATLVGADGTVQELAANSHANGTHKHGSGPHHKRTEITITRRLYRSGESEYLVDGKSARLRDIQDLFSGTGLGPESYAIIEQGRIGQILSNKPADRRAIIEEAAGIGRYKTRKRLAEAKLENAKQNLSRVFDILEEVGRQVNSLKRQASKAKRYQELREEMLGHLRQAVSGRYHLLQSEMVRLTEDSTASQTAFHQLSAEVQSKEQEHTRTREFCYQVESQLTASRARVAELNLETERTRSRLELQAKEISAIENRLTAGEGETQELELRHQREAAELAAHLERVMSAEGELALARERQNAKAAERDQFQNQIREGERGLEASRQHVLRLMHESSTLRNQLAQANEYLAAMERDAERARKEEESSSAELARLDRGKEELSARMSARQMELESLCDRRARVEEELKDRQQRTIAARQNLNALREALSKQKARKESLEGILSHRAYTTESVKRLFTGSGNHEAGAFRPLGVLADFVEVVKPEWERASEEFLHDELEYVVVHGWNDAEQGVDTLRAGTEGRATFLVHPESGESDWGAPDLSNEPGVAGTLRDALRLTNGFAGAPKGLVARLERCYLVTERESARRLARQHPDCYFLLSDGASYHGHTVTGGKKDAGGPLALKRELRELMVQVETREREADDMTSSLEDLERETALFAEELEQVRGMQQRQEKDALALDHEHRKLAEEYARAGSRLSSARLELERLAEKSKLARAQNEQNEILAAQKDQARFDQEKALESARSEFEAIQAQVHRISEEYTGLRAELAAMEERARAEKSASARLEHQLNQVAQRRQQLFADLERMGTERARLLSNNIELDQRAQLLADHSAEAIGRVELLTTEEAGGRAAMIALDDALKALRIDAQKAQERRSHLDVELARKQSELKYLDETSRKELSVPASEVAQLQASSAGEAITQKAEEASAEPEVDGERVSVEPASEGATQAESGPETIPAIPATLREYSLADVEESEQRYQEVRARIDALGPVNTQALEEYQEAQQRYEFLNTQRQDLIDSIRDTEKAIQELDGESRRRFKEAFEAINGHFKEMFKTLFGGGQGEMRLTDEANLAESGIDILASPPGKKLQHIALLSGGEKCLTAMALLMAIFRHVPSPFCILDEVDAPLDEPNIQRLTRLVKEMSDDTQFIVITHAKRTMETASALYGVTMQEPGVSKLVSVKFDPQPAAAVPPPRTAVLAAV